MRARLASFVGLSAAAVIGLTLAPGAESAKRAAAAGCDASRPGLVHYAGKAPHFSPTRSIPCLTDTFADYGEANIVQTASGAILHGGVYGIAPGGDGPAGGLARSTNGGIDWRYQQFPSRTTPPETSRGAGDPQLFVDPLTNRVWYTTISINGSNPGFCQTDISYSDDNGATWVNYPDPPMWGCPAFDFPRPFTGPPTTSASKKVITAARAKNPKAYPNIFYLCKSSHLMPDRQCWKSLDGGLSFVELGGSPTDDVAGSMGAWTADVRGWLYGISDSTLNISKDEGDTWTQTPLPAFLQSATALLSPRPEIDRDGNVYVGAVIDGLPNITYLRAPWSAKHPHWAGPFAVQMPGHGNGDPGVRHVDEMGIGVGKPGHVAIAYVGNSDTSDTPDVPDGYHKGGPHHGYLTTSDDLFTAKPEFRSVQVDSDKKPLLPYGFPAFANTSVTVSRADYIGVTIGPSGQPWAYFFRDNCPRPGVCKGLSPLAAVYNIWTNWSGAVATMLTH